MKLIALERSVPDVTPEMFAPHLRAEARRVWALQQSGVLREIWFRADRPEAVLVLEAESVDAAREAVSSLPLVANGLTAFEVIPLVPYPGLARLFGDAASA